MSELSLVKRSGTAIATGVITDLDATNILTVSGIGFRPTKVVMTMVRTDVYAVSWYDFISSVFTDTGGIFKSTAVSTAGFHGIDGKVAFTPNPDGFTLSTPSGFAYKFRASKGFNIWWMATDEN